MAVVLRLLGLNIEAGFEDIRGFFQGLPIPEGGVHITGGKLGEAFIIFSTERAGQLAMLHSGKPLRGSTITLQKSSVVELKHKMELELMSKKGKCASVEKKSVARPTDKTVLFTAFMRLAAAFQELQSDQQMNQVRLPPVCTTRITKAPESGEDAVEKRPNTDQPSAVTNPVNAAKRTRHVEEKQGSGKEIGACKPGYLRLYGVPVSITKHEVCEFLKGLNVVDIITETLQEQDQCCLVKMASFKEAEEGLKCTSTGPGNFQVAVRLAHERTWENAKQQLKSSTCSTFTEQDKVSPEKRLHRHSPVKRPCSSQGSPNPPTKKRQRSNTPSFNTEYCVMVRNLPTTITKTQIKDLFSCHHLLNSKILHLLNKQRERTSTAFIIFTEPEDYTLAMNMNGSRVGSQIIDVSSITMEKMKDLLYQNKSMESDGSPSSSSQPCTVLSCIYARNFPADVRKADVQSFFRKYNLNKEDVWLLEDKNGNRVGEAVIHFGREDRAREALNLDRERFRQEPIILACISTKQMKELLHTAR